MGCAGQYTSGKALAIRRRRAARAGGWPRPPLGRDGAAGGPGPGGQPDRAVHGRGHALAQVLAGAGLGRVEVTALDVPTPFASFEDYWLPFLGGQGPAPAYAMALDEVARTRLRDHLRERVPAAADGSIRLTARAWAARGTVAD